jgi:retron-type reverse transcriptase
MYEFPGNWKVDIESINDLHHLLDSEFYLPDFTNAIHDHFKEKEHEDRQLTIPSTELKSVQRQIYNQLFKFNLPDYVQGGVSGRSIVSNAKQHTNQKWVYCVDIVKFFPNSHHSRVYEVFKSLGCNHSVSRLLKRLTTHNYELPQGAPTSPILANLLLHNLDKRVQELCRQTGLTYARYFDDITLSGRQNPRKFDSKIHQIARDSGYEIHVEEKVRLMHQTDIQEVTGIIVNTENLELPDNYVQKLKDQIELAKTNNFSDQYYENPTKYVQEIQGKIAFLNSVNQETGSVIKEKFDKIQWPYK